MPRNMKNETEQTFTIKATKEGLNCRIDYIASGSDFFFYTVIVETIKTLNKRANERGSYKCKNGFWLAVMDAVNDEIGKEVE